MKIKAYKPTREDIERNIHNKTANFVYRDIGEIYEIFIVLFKKIAHLKVHRIDDKPIHNYGFARN